MASALISRTTRFQGLKLTLRLENEFWMVLQEIAAARGVSLGELIASVELGPSNNRTSAVRVLALMTCWRLAMNKPDDPTMQDLVATSMR